MPKKTPLTPSERSLKARAAAYALHSQVNGAEHTAPARQAFMDRFEKQVDPDCLLTPQERARRAECARKAHFVRMAFESAKARRRNAEDRSRLEDLRAAAYGPDDPHPAA